jgi:hypothetical protein
MTYHAALAALASGINTIEVRAAIRAHVDAQAEELRRVKAEREFWKEVRKRVYAERRERDPVA